MQRLDFHIFCGRASMFSGIVANLGICLLYPAFPTAYPIHLWLVTHKTVTIMIIKCAYCVLVPGAVVGLLARDTMAGKFGLVLSVVAMMFFGEYYILAGGLHGGERQHFAPYRAQSWEPRPAEIRRQKQQARGRLVVGKIIAIYLRPAQNRIEGSSSPLRLINPEFPPVNPIPSFAGD